MVNYMKIDIGIIGGSGLYSLLDDAKEKRVNTKYGKPSDSLFIGSIYGKNVAFIPRHGRKHNLPPHLVPYKANIQALNDLGVKRIIATNAVGSINPAYTVGQIAAFSQFVNFTSGRPDTFFESSVAHVSLANPYCDELRKVSAKAGNKLKLNYRDGGSVLVVNGPRFSTKAESLFFSRQGFDMINMTQYPEVTLARESCICYIALGIVTDYDAGLVGKKGIKPVSHREVAEAFSKNITNIKELVKEIIKQTPEKRGCVCKDALDDAIIKV
jgi:5'-methylthioadenosine phosphorylase